MKNHRIQPNGAVIPCLIMLLFVFPVFTYATADVACVNHITKEVHIFEDIDYIGIGWESMGENEDKFQEYLDQGYAYARFPHKIEFGIVVLASFFLGFGILFTINYFGAKKGIVEKI